MRKIQPVLISGLVIGILDGLTAAIHYYLKTGKNPAAVYKFIASGVLGPTALKGGADMVILGIVLHLMIAMVFAFLFYLIYERTGLFRLSPWLVGLIYGSFVWVVMNLVVVPLSRTPHITLTTSRILTSWLILVVMIGLPLAFMARRRILVS